MGAGSVTRRAATMAASPPIPSTPDAVAHAKRLIESRQYVLDSDWGEVQPAAGDENAFFESHSWEEYVAGTWGLTEGPKDETKLDTPSYTETSGGFTAPA